MKRIQIESHRILFENQVFSSHSREVNFKDYDYFKTVHEESENGTFEAVWLIKDGKLADSFSTYQYSNYETLKTSLDLKYQGGLEISPIKQLLCRFGMKI